MEKIATKKNTFEKEIEIHEVIRRVIDAFIK